MLAFALPDTTAHYPGIQEVSHFLFQSVQWSMIFFSKPQISNLRLRERISYNFQQQKKFWRYVWYLVMLSLLQCVCVCVWLLMLEQETIFVTRTILCRVRYIYFSAFPEILCKLWWEIWKICFSFLIPESIHCNTSCSLRLVPYLFIIL